MSTYEYTDDDGLDDPAIHGPHRYADDTEMRDCPGSSLYERIAETLRTHTYAGKGVPDQDCGRPERCVCGAVFDQWYEHFAEVAARLVVEPEVGELRTRIEMLHREIADAVTARDKDNAYNEFTRTQLKQLRGMIVTLREERDEALAALEET